MEDSDSISSAQDQITLDFIKLVKARPELYVTNRGEFMERDRLVRIDGLWTEVAEAMTWSVEECRRKWRNLRLLLKKQVDEESKTSSDAKETFYLDFLKTEIVMQKTLQDNQAYKDDYDASRNSLKNESETDKEPANQPIASAVEVSTVDVHKTVTPLVYSCTSDEATLKPLVYSGIEVFVGESGSENGSEDNSSLLVERKRRRNSKSVSDFESEDDVEMEESDVQKDPANQNITASKRAVVEACKKPQSVAYFEFFRGLDPDFKKLTAERKKLFKNACISTLFELENEQKESNK